MEKKDISLEEIKRVFEEVFYGDLPKEDQKYVKKLDTPELDILDQVLEGYSYMIDTGSAKSQEGSGRMKISTGSGGVREYVKSCRKKGIPDSIAIQSIFVYIDGKYHPFSSVRKTKTNGK